MRFSVNVGGTNTNAINIRGNNGHVGIGSAEGGTSPVYPLDVYNATADTVARFTSGDNRARPARGKTMEREMRMNKAGTGFFRLIS